MRQDIDSVESRLRYEKDRSRKILNTSHRPDKKCTSKIIYHCILSHLRPDEEKENFCWMRRKQINFLEKPVFSLRFVDGLQSGGVSRRDFW
jgi:hypothetical protein